MVTLQPTQLLPLENNAVPGSICQCSTSSGVIRHADYTLTRFLWVSNSQVSLSVVLACSAPSSLDHCLVTLYAFIGYDQQTSSKVSSAPFLAYCMLTAFREAVAEYGSDPGCESSFPTLVSESLMKVEALNASSPCSFQQYGADWNT